MKRTTALFLAALLAVTLGAAPAAARSPETDRRLGPGCCEF